MIEGHHISWLFHVNLNVLICALFASMLTFIAIGSFAGRKRKAKHELVENPANNTLSGSMFGLLAFLLAFTFGMTSNRYDARRNTPIIESNEINTAIMRADLYPDSVRAAFRQDLKNYLQARIDNIAAGIDIKKISAATRETKVQADKLWKRATDFAKNNPGTFASAQMVPALNTMFNSARSNLYSELMKVPSSIIVMLLTLALVIALLLGYVSVGKGRFDWMIGIGFCLLTCLVIYIILDLDRSRRGLIQLRTSHEAIISLLKEFEGDTSLPAN